MVFKVVDSTFSESALQLDQSAVEELYIFRANDSMCHEYCALENEQIE